MKTFLTSLLSVTILALSISGCGKDGGGGGGGGQSGNFYSGQNLDQQSQSYLNEIRNWYNQNEVSTLQRYKKVKQNISVNNNTSCPGEIKEYFGFIRVCVYSGSSSTSNSNEVRYLVGPGLNGSIINPYFCVTTDGYCPQGPQTYPGKGSNQSLQDAISGRNGSLYLLNISKSGSVYQLSYGQSSLDSRARIVYKIDTSLHSLYNPVEVTDMAASQPTSEWISFNF